MYKVEGLKSRWFKELTYGILAGGVFDGMPGFRLVLSGAEIDEGNPLDFLQELLKKITGIPHGVHDIFRISGGFNPSIESMTFLRTLLHTLQGYGFNLQIVLREAMIEDIPLNLFSWVVYETSTGFVPYPANEIWYRPSEGSDLSKLPLSIPPNLTGNAIIFLGGRFKEEEVLKFFASRQERWAILR